MSDKKIIRNNIINSLKSDPQWTFTYEYEANLSGNNLRIKLDDTIKRAIFSTTQGIYRELSINFGPWDWYLIRRVWKAKRKQFKKEQVKSSIKARKATEERDIKLILMELLNK